MDLLKKLIKAELTVKAAKAAVVAAGVTGAVAGLRKLLGRGGAR